MNQSKIIHAYFLDKIVHNLEKIAEVANEPLNDHVRRVRYHNQDFIAKWLDKADVFDPALQKEVIAACKEKDPAAALKTKGWIVWG